MHRNLNSVGSRQAYVIQVKHKKPKAKPAPQSPLEALQPFELRQQQQQQQQMPAPAQPEPRHVPPPPPPPPQPPQAPAAFDSKPAPWAHKRPAAVPGTSPSVMAHKLKRAWHFGYQTCARQKCLSCPSHLTSTHSTASSLRECDSPGVMMAVAVKYCIGLYLASTSHRLG